MGTPPGWVPPPSEEMEQPPVPVRRWNWLASLAVGLAVVGVIAVPFIWVGLASLWSEPVDEDDGDPIVVAVMIGFVTLVWISVIGTAATVAALAAGSVADRRRRTALHERGWPGP